MNGPAIDRFLLSFDAQSKACRALGSPFHATLCECLRDALPEADALRDLASTYEGDPVSGFFAVRLLGGVHAMALAGEAPALARHFPSCGGDGDAQAAASLLPAFVARERERLRPWLASFPQTNEVKRSAGLLPGFLGVARATGHPLRLLEIGSSAGLNQLWDRFHYAYENAAGHRVATWGDASSPVRLHAQWRSREAPALDVQPVVASRAGCDIAPLSVESARDRCRLEAYVWPDQLDRLDHLRAAIELARAGGVSVERAAAADWLARMLDTTHDGVTTVIFHSIMWAYVPVEERAAVTRCIEAAGARATMAAPLAWLSLEDASPVTAVWLRLWPHAPAPRVLAHAHPHVAWLDDLAGF